MPLRASIFLEESEGGQKRHKTVEVSLAVVLALEEGCLGSWPLPYAMLPHPDKE